MSLSGVHTTIRSTFLSSAQRVEAAAMASSASNSTIGQRTIPSASTAASAIGNWSSRSARHPERRLVARKEVVAERLDDAVRGAPDVRGTFLAEQIEELLDEPADAAQDDPVAADDRRAGRVMRAEQLVGGVDEVELHARQDVGPTTSTPADCICSMARLSSPARRLTGMQRWASTDVSNPSRRASMAVALTQ